MRLPSRIICVVYPITLLLWSGIAVAAKGDPQCPIGFNLAYPNEGDPICYQLKGPEIFTEKFNDCVGNLYTSKRYHSLNFPKTNRALWTEYKSMYPGGPFIDWSYTESAGDILTTTYDVKYDAASFGVEEELCVVIDPVSNFTATRCDEKHYRYCFVRPYRENDEMDRDNCEGLEGSWRLYSPLSTCLAPVTGVGGGTVRATWRQAHELCAKRGGALLNKGWRYSNHGILQNSGSHLMYPLGIVMNSNHSLLRYEAENDKSEIPDTDWHFPDGGFGVDAVYGAISGDFWHLVNSSYIFFDVVCERSIVLPDLTLDVSVDRENKLRLKVNGSIDKDDVQCYTDSVIYFPSVTSIIREDDEDEYDMFSLNPAMDGYYWCIQTDFKNYQVSESNRQLFIRSRESLINLYACKIRLKKEYRFENLDKVNRVWRKRLEEFIYYRTKYLSIYGEINATNPYEAMGLLKDFKSTKPELDWKTTDVIYNLKIKRLYMDAKTALVHIKLNPEMKPLTPGVWENVEVLSMKPAYFCRGFDSIPTTPLGESVISAGCRTYTCIGDFNEGVQWVESAAAGCTTKPPVKIDKIIIVEDVKPTTGPQILPDINERTMLPIFPDSSTMENSTSEEVEVCADQLDEKNPQPIEFSPSRSKSINCQSFTPPRPTSSTPTPSTPDPTEVSTATSPPDVITFEPITEYPTIKPTTSPLTTAPPPLPADEQLEQVLEGLEGLLKNDTLQLESITTAFDQVNDILNLEEDELEIPGRLLHMLDELGSKVELNGATTASTVRDNVALLLADVSVENPVRGLVVAARDNDSFQNDSFSFITNNISSTELLANNTEALVYLPESVTRTPRRVSFVAFRTQRAFQSQYAVNSRVFSVNVENLTTFEKGEVIDIHLTPMIEEPERNLSRVCAYWHFVDDGGYWSQDGCRLIRAREPGLLDTCRCDHLTHFAEILVPRTAFSDRNEAALEILSIVGCFLSLFGLMMIALTASIFRAWRRDYSNKIWLQLCAAIFVLVVCFLVIVFADFDHYNVPCMLVGVALHYSVLASFCWMLVAAVLSYRRLVLVFTRDVSHKLLRASAFAWGTPCAVVGVLLSVDPHSYEGRFDEKTPSGAFCYPSGLGLWLAVYAPVAAMLLANWTLFALIVRSVFASRRIQRHGDSNEALRCASVSCLLVFLFGLPWIFGLFANNIVLAYLFTLTATFQGFVLFVFFVLGNKKTRDLWLNKLKIKQTRKVPVTSSTYTNRSTGPGWRGGNPGLMSSIEAKTSKPRSLSTPDDSRFS